LIIRLKTSLQDEIVASVASEMTGRATSSSRGAKAIALVHGKASSSLSEAAKKGKDMLTKSKQNPPPAFNPDDVDTEETKGEMAGRQTTTKASSSSSSNRTGGRVKH